MTCRCCPARADVAVHVVEPGEPLLYCKLELPENHGPRGPVIRVD